MLGNTAPGRAAPAVRGLAAAVLLAALAGCPATLPPAPPPAQDAADAEAPPAAVQPPPPGIAAPPPARFPGVARGRVRAALLVPLSGPRAAIGQALADAAELALFDRAGESLVLLPKDTEGTPDGADAAMRDALADGADVVLGPLFADSARRVAPAAAAAGVPAVAFTNDRRAAGGGLFVMGLTPDQQVAAVVAHARADGHARVAALVPDTPFGHAVVAALHMAALRNAAAIADVRYYPPAEAGTASAPVQSLAAAREAPGGGFDALLVAGAGDTLAALAPLLPWHGLDPAEVRFLGAGQWKDPAILGEPALLGALFAAPADAAFKVFAARYRAAFGAEPPRIAALGYDAVALVAAIAALSAEPGFDAARLTDPAGFAGIDGIFRFGADRVAERGLAVYRVARTGFDVAVPAPERFEVPAF